MFSTIFISSKQMMLISPFLAAALAEDSQNFKECIAGSTWAAMDSKQGYELSDSDTCESVFHPEDCLKHPKFAECCPDMCNWDHICGGNFKSEKGAELYQCLNDHKPIKKLWDYFNPYMLGDWSAKHGECKDLLESRDEAEISLCCNPDDASTTAERRLQEVNKEEEATEGEGEGEKNLTLEGNALRDAMCNGKSSGSSTPTGEGEPTNRPERRTKANGSHVMEGDKFECTVKAGKAKKLFAIVDFDRTLTHYKNPDGSKGPSSHNVINLSDEKQAAKDADYKKYHEIEIDPNMTTAEKLPLMEEWYGKTHGLIESDGVTMDRLLHDVTTNKNIQLRKGVQEFFELCKKLEIPIVVMSAGLGDVLNEVLKHQLVGEFEWGVAANSFEWSEAGEIVGVKPPLVHMFNKGWAGVSQEIRDKFNLDDKTNVLTVGDSHGDATMANGSEFGRFKVGFLNDHLAKKKSQYDCLYDRVLHGGLNADEEFEEGYMDDFMPIVELLKKIESAEEDPSYLDSDVCSNDMEEATFDEKTQTCTYVPEQKKGNAGALTTLVALLSVSFLL